MHVAWRRAVHVAGGLLGLAGVIFVLIKLNDLSAGMNLHAIATGRGMLLALLTTLYAASGVLLARGWWCLLGHLGVRPRWGWTWRTYARSQLAKYVPGNIFHLASRQVLGLVAGLPGRALVRSTAWELGLIAAIGAVFFALAWPARWPLGSVWPSWVAFLVLVTSLIYLARRLGSADLARAAAWQTAFLIGSGLVFTSTLIMLTPISAINVPMLCGAYVVAWLAGLLTPGSPAGVGVREVVVLFLLQGVVPDADLLLAVLLARAINIVGDLLFFLFGTFSPHPS